MRSYENNAKSGALTSLAVRISDELPDDYFNYYKLKDY